MKGLVNKLKAEIARLEGHRADIVSQLVDISKEQKQLENKLHECTSELEKVHEELKQAEAEPD